MSRNSLFGRHDREEDEESWHVHEGTRRVGDLLHQVHQAEPWHVPGSLFESFNVESWSFDCDASRLDQPPNDLLFGMFFSQALSQVCGATTGSILIVGYGLLCMVGCQSNTVILFYHGSVDAVRPGSAGIVARFVVCVVHSWRWALSCGVVHSSGLCLLDRGEFAKWSFLDRCCLLCRETQEEHLRNLI